MRRVSVSYAMQSAQLKEIRRADPQVQGRHSFTAQQQTLRRLNRVRRVLRAREERESGLSTVQAPRPVQSGPVRRRRRREMDPGRTGGWARAAFQGVGSVKVRQHRPVPGTVKSLQLKREHRRWYVIVTTDADPIPLPSAGRGVGVDLGVARFLTTSDGEVIANPKFLAASAEAIADIQRRKDRARHGSGNRKRLRARPGQGMAQGPQPAPRLPPQDRPGPRGHLRHDRAGKTQYRRDDPSARAEARPGQAGRSCRTWPPRKPG